MNLEIITKEDLRELKNEMLNAIKQSIQPGQGQSKKFLKSNEVRRLLNVSQGTLQNLRINGTLPCTQIGSICCYKLEDINRLSENENHKNQNMISLNGINKEGLLFYSKQKTSTCY